jgi:serine/threonine-protein kinase
MKFGLFEFQPATLELTRNGNPLRLQELPARLLNALLQSPGSLVTREQLRAELWASGTFVQFDAGLNTAMNKLRLVLRDSAENPQFIETVPRVGYRFIAPVERTDLYLVPAHEKVTTLPVALAEAEPAAVATPVVSPLAAGRKWPWMSVPASALVIGCAIALTVAAIRQHRPRPTVRFSLDLPAGQDFQFYSGRQIAISPDGSMVAWIAVSNRVRQIYVRKLVEATFHPLAGTEQANSLCFSPAGDWVAYISQAGELRKASVDGRWNVKLLTLGPRSGVGSVLWGNDGWIYFSADGYGNAEGDDSRKLFRVRAAGGAAEPFLKAVQPQSSWYPVQWLPQGLLCTANYAPTDRAVVLVSFTGTVHQILEHASGGRYLGSGHLVFDRSGNLMTVPFDPDRMRVTGKPEIAVPNIAPDRYAGLQMDVSEGGDLIYFTASIVRETEPVWVDHAGREYPSHLPPGRYSLLDLSPDGSNVLLTRFDPGEQWKIYSVQPDKGTRNEVLSGDSPHSGAIWSPDGRTVAVAATLQGERMDTLYLKPLDATGGARPLLGDSFTGKFPQSWSKAANAIAYTDGYHQATKRDVWVLPLASGAQPRCIACTAEDDILPSFSPDGGWIAYTSEAGGREDVYVQRYPGPSTPVRISGDGGRNSLWAPSSRVLYYRLGSDMWAAGFDPVLGKPGRPRKLFSGPYEAGTAWNRNALISPDGSRFLLLKRRPDPPDYRRIQVVLNWVAEPGR